MKTVYNKLLIVLFLLLAIVFSACDDFLKPYEQTGKHNSAILWGNPSIAEGILLRAYGMLPNEYLSEEEFGADDAVTNKLDHAMVVMATGAWSARTNPLDSYANCYSALLQLNLFFENVDKVNWAPSSHLKDSIIKVRLKGETFGLRAYYSWLLLRNVGGKSLSGELLGYQITTSSTLNFEQAKLPRSTYTNCVKQIFADCDSAIKMLPLRYTDTGLTADEKEAKGVRFQNRINGITVKLIKSRVALMAASEAFSASGITMQQAAEISADVINTNALDKLLPQDIQFYLQARSTDLSYFLANSEIFWSTYIQTKSSARESYYYPPSLYGKGLINPSQNLVDAFGDKYGYPITHASTAYDKTKPYSNRDPRLSLYIYYDGSYTETGNKLDIKTGEKDGVGKTVNSTRTGYYMRKLLDENVVLTPGMLTATPHFYVYARYTEALLNFAEAANQAVGPDGIIGGYSARSIVKKIRERAGVFSSAYINSMDKEALAKLIRNERRIELCFEGFRFWDLRRWNDLSAMNQTVKGIDLQINLAVDVELRRYEPYMIYGPIPYSETLKYNIQQNAGWE